jgi:membrane-bound lytic murein transglycosylase D
MPSLVIALALAISGPADAAPRLFKKRQSPQEDAAEPTPEEREQEARRPLQPAMEPAEGSLWDYVEQVEGSLPSNDDTVQESEELDAERQAEAAFLQQLSAPSGPPADFYTDPVGALSVDPLHLDLVDPSEFDIPVVVNADVVRWMEYFTGRGRKYYTRWLARSTKYRPMMYEKLDAAGLPRDLVYLSMIESGYATHAYSRAAAVGLWQFITPTAREWGMRVDWWVDDRRDPEMATDAAIRFLGHLNKKFGHWYLAWAAYNGGPSRVARAVSRHGTKDFWTLVEKDSFPSETDNYVPKLIAAAIIGHHPERYGFTDIQFQDRLEYDTIEVGPSFGVDVLARCAGISVEEFQALNPHIRRFALPPDGKTHVLRVPKGSGKRTLAAVSKVPASERISFQQHKVRKGETLGRIAQRYGVAVSEVQRINKITNPNRIYVGMELVIPAPGSRGMPAPPSAKPKALASTAGGGAKAASTPKSKKVSHVVRKGEALSAIAERYGAKTSDVMRWNGIKNANRIYVGQKLTLYEKASNWTTYKVRKGENLSLIAQRNGCSVSDLKSWNNLGSSKIYVGQTLKIRRR